MFWGLYGISAFTSLKHIEGENILKDFSNRPCLSFNLIPLTNCNYFYSLILNVIFKKNFRLIPFIVLSCLRIKHINSEFYEIHLKLWPQVISYRQTDTHKLEIVMTLVFTMDHKKDHIIILNILVRLTQPKVSHSNIPEGPINRVK